MLESTPHYVTALHCHFVVDKNRCSIPNQNQIPKWFIKKSVIIQMKKDFIRVT